VVKKILLHFSAFSGGGIAYGGIEILWRGFTHISMILLGGLCFVCLLRISKYKLRLGTKSVLGGGFITFAEFLAGCVLNLWLGLEIWDYSQERFQFLGQVSLLYFFYWCVLSFVVIAACQILRLWAPKFRSINI
jgi:uncharacterized membrane protein